MQHTPSDDRHTTGFSAQVLHIVRARIGYTLAGAFAFIGTAAAVHAATAPSSSAAGGTDSLNLHQTTSQVVAPASDPSNQSQSAADTTNTVHASVSAGTGHTPEVQLQVNGQNIPVPANGTTQQTVTGTDGSQTSVNASSNVSSEGDASNSSTTTFSLNVTSNSSTEGGSSQ